MIRINLLPVREITAAFGRRQEIMVAGVSVGLIVVVLAGVYLMQLRKISHFEGELAGLRREIEVLNAKAKGVGEMEKKVAELREKVKVIDDLNKKKTGPVRVMESLSSAMPARLWLTQFREAGGNVTIDGLAVDNQTIAEFLKALFLQEVPEIYEGIVKNEKFLIAPKFVQTNFAVSRTLGLKSGACLGS